jgi:hypothetical protein
MAILMGSFFVLLLITKKDFIAVILSLKPSENKLNGYVTGISTTIELLLRRTLQRSVL